MKTNQKFYPEFGYTTPIETQEECSNPAFADKYLHRVGLFNLGEPNDNGCKGNRILKKCVNCGREFDVYFKLKGDD